MKALVIIVFVLVTIAGWFIHPIIGILGTLNFFYTIKKFS